MTATVKPFPAGLMPGLQAKAARLYPDPVPPTIEVQTVTGPEESEDIDDPDYLTEKVRVENLRAAFVGDAIVDFCVEVDLGQYAEEIRRLERYTDLPEDPDGRRLEFLKQFALRSRGDWEALMADAMEGMTVSDPEVRERMDSFRRALEGNPGSKPAPPGPAEV